ncbi:MAG: AAA family ATPase [Sedimentisphaerales bacterium]|jgi:chromosome partitioning protein|nr:AAA family ATPase [Sedimentisphaerales bacterium]NLZ07289.1 AAA family ATPase [Phycisphaerae bacterium]HNY78296.1 AAA family ATPase [Sedimentisphaerales bacterium]HOC61843.1 AAA family ATPase [Sedimentisphaerales bacterium]HOH64303.1 AAA family ATPase [Sedimentisphaerales bacterium]
MRTIAVVNQKGGCGKTTVSINLASALADLGKKVLLVDMDSQSHCAVGLAVPEEQIEQSIYDVLISESRNEPMRLSEILWQIGERLELAPASIDLSAFEQQMAGIPDRETCLKKVLDGVTNDYDFAVIDCPPAVSLLTFNALRAATDVVVPVETGYFALHGLSKQLETLSILCKRCQQQVSVRVLASMYDIRTKMAREILAELRSHFSDRMFKTVVNFNTRIKEAASFGQPINEYDPASKGQQDFRSLAQELIGADERLVTKSKRLVDTLADQLESIGASATELLRTTQPQGPARPASPAPAIGQAASSPTRTPPAEAPARPPTPATAPVPQAIAPPVVKPPVEPVAAPAAETPAFEDELIELPESAAASSVTPLETFAAVPATTDTKLSDYYGVSQIRDAVVFVTLYPRATNVQIAGDFNNWQPAATSMERVGNSGVWQAKLKLPHGTYRYRLVVDGQWQQDPYNERTELNPYGELNSVIEIQ